MKGLASLLLLVVAGAEGAQPEAAPVPRVDCTRSHLVVPLPVGPQPLIVVAPGDGWLLIAERGQDVEIDGADVVASVQVPPRLGLRAFDVRGGLRLNIRRVRAGAGIGAVDVRLHCDIAAVHDVAGWLRAATPVASRILAPADDTAALLRDIDALIASAPSAPQRARGLHLRAQALFVNGRSADAVGAFATAEAAWIAAAQIDPALAARVGRAEDANRAARYDDALALARSFPARAPRDSYFAVRLAASACLAEHYLARLDAAQTCYRSVVGRLDALGESLEAAAHRIDFAALLRATGRLADSARILRAALASATGPQSDTLRGRAFLGLVDVALSRGDLGTALSQAESAIDAFIQAKQPRWQATTLLKLADVYVELGTGAEALAVVDRAMAGFDAANAPSRVATARVLRAHALALENDIDAAYADLDAAADIYRSLKMTAEYQSTRVSRAALALRADDAVTAAFALDAAGDVRSDEAALVRAQIDLDERRIDAAREQIERLRGKPLRLSDAGDRERVAAAIEAAKGDDDAALARLIAHAHTLRQLAEATRNPLFSEVLLGLQGSVREAAVDVLANDLARHGDGARVAAALWAFVAARRTTVGEDAVVDASRTASFDRALAREFLDRDAGAIDVRALLSLLRDRAATPRRAAEAPPTLAGLQMRMPRGGALLVFAAGRRAALRLFVTPLEIRVDRMAPADVVRPAIDRVRAAVADPATSTVTLDAASHALEALLFAGLGDVAVPGSLLVLGDDYGGAVPWALLHWPGGERPLGLATDVALADLGPSGRADARATRSLHVLSVPSRDAGGLPSLSFARVEADIIGRGASLMPALLPPTRAALLDALRKPGSWVHVATHGRGGGDRIGGSGVWLQNDVDSPTPDYVSGVDVMGWRVQSQLVVLNACDVAGATRGADASSRNLARALVRAGAAHVVAAQWAVSDAATLAWVPAFYARLAQDGSEGAGAALVEARLALWQKRAFRHPFYWASLTHYARLP